MWCKLSVVIGFNVLIIILTLIEMIAKWKIMDNPTKAGSIIIEVILWVLLGYGIYLYNETQQMLN